MSNVWQWRKRFSEGNKQSCKKGSFNKLLSSGFTYPNKRNRESDRRFTAKISFTPRIYYGISVLYTIRVSIRLFDHFDFDNFICLCHSWCNQAPMKVYAEPHEAAAVQLTMPTKDFKICRCA